MELVERSIFTMKADKLTGAGYYLQAEASVTATENTVMTAVLAHGQTCLLYTSDAADERSSVDLGGRRIIKQRLSSVFSGHLAIREHYTPRLSPRTTALHQQTSR